MTCLPCPGHQDRQAGLRAGSEAWFITGEQHTMATGIA